MISSQYHNILEISLDMKNDVGNITTSQMGTSIDIEADQLSSPRMANGSTDEPLCQRMIEEISAPTYTR